MKTLRFNTIKILNEQKQQNIYKKMHKSAKYEYESVGWLSEERQNLRFEKLVEGLNLDGKKILDFGCGLGAFCGFLKERGVTCDYTGIDMVESFVKKAKHVHPESRFIKASILDVVEQFDYVFSSGVYAFCQKELFVEYVKKSFELSSEAYRFNILLDAKSGGYLKIGQRELEEVVRKFGCNTMFIDGYLENDITVHMGKL
jgi:cyclopropane fatty-acyl-phospholipid synthase-like methyltransferase